LAAGLLSEQAYTALQGRANTALAREEKREMEQITSVRPTHAVSPPDAHGASRAGDDKAAAGTSEAMTPGEGGSVEQRRPVSLGDSSSKAA